MIGFRSALTRNQFVNGGNLYHPIGTRYRHQVDVYHDTDTRGSDGSDPRQPSSKVDACHGVYVCLNITGGKTPHLAVDHYTVELYLCQHVVRHCSSDRDSHPTLPSQEYVGVCVRGELNLQV